MEHESSIMLVGGPADGARLDVPAEPGGLLIIGGHTYVVDVDGPVARPQMPRCPCGYSLEQRFDTGDRDDWHWQCPQCGLRFWFPTLDEQAGV